VSWQGDIGLTIPKEKLAFSFGIVRPICKLCLRQGMFERMNSASFAYSQVQGASFISLML
jgi:hypothetical protein